MTRTDVVASSRPQKADEATMRKGSPRFRRLIALPVAFALTMALFLPAAALAEETSSYTTSTSTSTTTTTPTTTETTPATTPTTGTSPSKEATTPEKSAAPETTKSEPAAASSPTKATSLPFTGFDLRWIVAAGIVLLAMGLSILGLQRRQRGVSRR